MLFGLFVEVVFRTRVASVYDGWIFGFGLVADRSFRLRLHLNTFLRGVTSTAFGDAFANLRSTNLSDSMPSAAKSGLLINATCGLFRRWNTDVLPVRGRIDALLRAN